MGTEAAAIKFVREKAPTVPVPTLLADYIDRKAGRAYTLVSSVPGEDLNQIWRKLDEKQREAVLRQVVAHIMTLAKLKNDKPVSAEGLRIYEPYLSLHETEGGSTYETGSLRMRDLLDPNKSKAYEEIWPAKSDDKSDDKFDDKSDNKCYDKCDEKSDNKPGEKSNDKPDHESNNESDKPFAFYHADLGPSNIKVKIEMEEAKVTGILDWEISGYLPIEWICTILEYHLAWIFPGMGRGISRNGDESLPWLFCTRALTNTNKNTWHGCSRL